MNDNTNTDVRTARQILEDHARERGVDVAFEVVRRGRRRGDPTNTPWTPARRAAKAEEYEGRLAAARLDRQAYAARLASAEAAVLAGGGRVAEVEARAWKRELRRAVLAEGRALSRLSAMRRVPDNVVGL